MSETQYCPLCGSGPEEDACVEPTPEALEAWAEWFDDPNKSPSIDVSVTHRRYAPSTLLREIARRLRAAREE